MKSFESAISDFLQSRQAMNRSEKTVIWYSEMLHTFLVWLESQELEGNWLTPELIESYITYRMESVASSTAANNFRALRAFFNWLEERHEIPSPMKNLQEPQIEPKEPRYASYLQFRQLADSIPNNYWIAYRDRLIVNTLYLCALRISEVVSLTIHSFDLGNHVLKVEKGKTGVDYVPLLPEVARAYTEFMYNRPATKFEEICLSGHGSGSVRGVLSTNGLRQRIRVLCKQADMPYLNPHSFRHGLAMYLLNYRGADMAVIQRLLRHSRISTTSDIYARWERHGLVNTYMDLMEG